MTSNNVCQICYLEPCGCSEMEKECVVLQVERNQYREALVALDIWDGNGDLDDYSRKLINKGLRGDSRAWKEGLTPAQLDAIEPSKEEIEKKLKEAAPEVNKRIQDTIDSFKVDLDKLNKPFGIGGME